jgi:hypothetical protein
MATRAQVGIGTITPDASAILDLSVDNLNSGYKKGFLGPRVALASQTDQVTIPSPASGLLVYNLGTAGLTYVGYVYWNGSEWRALSNVSISKGMVGSITCNGISAIPGTYTKGVPYTGTMMVPYTGGNGGVYEAQTIGPVNGLTATLSAGNFNVGSGTLAYTVTGTPTVTSPNVTSFLLTIGGKSCKADIGIGEGIAPGDLVYYRATMSASPGQVWLSAYVKDLPVIGGKLRLDAYFSSTSNQGGGTTSMSPRLVNVSNKPVKLWFSAMTTVDRFNAGNYLIAPGGNVELDNNIYLGYGFNDILGSSTPRFSDGGETNHQESITVDLSLDDKWYRIYYFPIVDNLNTPGTDDNLRQIYLSIQRLY